MVGIVIASDCLIITGVTVDMVLLLLIIIVDCFNYYRV